MENSNNTHIISSFQNFFSQKENNEHQYTKLYYNSIQAFQIYYDNDKNSNSDSISNISALLNTSKTRLRGLVLLKRLLDQCTSQVFLDSASKWLKIISDILQKRCSLSVHKQCCLVLKNLLSCSAKFSVLNREISTVHIPRLVPNLLEHETFQSKVISLCGFSACLSQFPNASRPFLTKIEKFISEIFSSDSSDLFEEAIECYSLLPLCGGVTGSQEKNRHAEAWRNHTMQTLDEIAELLHELYYNLDTDGCLIDVSQSQRLASIFEKQHLNVRSSHLLVSKLLIYTQCLSKLLLNEFPVVVEVPVQSILVLVSYGLSINSKDLLKKATQERALLASVIPAVHTQCLVVLSDLISCCKSNILAHANSITSLITQTFEWTNNNTSMSRQRKFSDLRSVAYQVLVSWIHAGGSFNRELTLKTLLANTYHDILPDFLNSAIQTELPSQNQSSAEPPTKKRKKLKRTGYSQLIEDHTTVEKEQCFANSKVCQSALQFLHLLILKHNILLELEDCQYIQSYVVQTLLRLQALPKGPVAPYECTKCQTLLYRVLLACTIAPRHDWPPPIHLSMKIFSVGQRNQCPEVATICIEALHSCRNIIHPIMPSFCPLIDPPQPSHEKDSAHLNTGFANVTASNGLLLVQNSGQRSDEKVVEAMNDESDDQNADDELTNDDKPCECPEESENLKARIFDCKDSDENLGDKEMDQLKYADESSPESCFTQSPQTDIYGRQSVNHSEETVWRLDNCEARIEDCETDCEAQSAGFVDTQESKSSEVELKLSSSINSIESEKTDENLSMDGMLSSFVNIGPDK